MQIGTHGYKNENYAINGVCGWKQSNCPFSPGISLCKTLAFTITANIAAIVI
jgi:hypothetical protein